jgi:probable addiction module antidote protein
MPLETRIFDPANYIDTDDARATYMTEALETGDPSFIADALGVIARSRGLNRVALDTGLSQEGLNRALSPDGKADLEAWLRVIRALGLRLTAIPAAY